MAKRPKPKYQRDQERMVRNLPTITSLEQIKNLPWGGNAFWDCPIMMKIERDFIRNPKFPKETRKRACELAGYLMTGEDYRFTKEYTFDDYLRIPS